LWIVIERLHGSRHRAHDLLAHVGRIRFLQTLAAQDKKSAACKSRTAPRRQHSAHPRLQDRLARVLDGCPSSDDPSMRSIR
jgi:hypothetical protein